MAELTGFWNNDKKAGIRNHVAVLALSAFCNTATRLISEAINGTIPITHPHGRTEFGEHRKRLEKSLMGIALNPNVNSLLVVGYEHESTQMFVNSIREYSKKQVESIVMLDGGTLENVYQGSKKALELVTFASETVREPIEFEDLTFGLKCGGTDTTSGIASSPAVGNTLDRIISQGGTAIFSETTEIIGAEHILAKRAVNKIVANKIYEAAKRNEDLAMSMGVNLLGLNPSLDNIKGGISTIEEKSLGAILKAGTSEIQDVLNYGETPEGKGLFFMDSPSAAQEVLTALFNAGCQAVLFSTGNGNPIGLPMAPVIKITGNPRTREKMYDHIDIDVSEIITSSLSVEDAGEKVLKETVKIINGKLTKSEVLGHREFTPIPIGL